MKNINIDRLLQTGIALSAEKNDYRLLTIILTAAMDIADCDGGTIYTVRDDALVFRVMITRSLGLCRGDDGKPIDLPPVPLSSKSHVCSRAANTASLINIPDVYSDDRFDFSGTKNYDKMTGYKTTSLLCIPMEDDKGRVIGVLQLLNAQDTDGEHIPFDPECEKVILSLASQAGICLTKMNYQSQITQLFNSFVRVMSAAIDARSPYNANHTRNMVKYGERFISWLNRTGNEWTFTPEQQDEFLMSIWLHDVGKLVTPRNIMDKSSRLGTATDSVMRRFELALLMQRINYLEGRITKEEYEAEYAKITSAQQLTQQANSAPYITDEILSDLSELREAQYTDTAGESHYFLTPLDFESLTVRKGTLTDSERKIMQEHVEMTERILLQMDFIEEYSRVPKWASMHHELANGKGYPNGLAGKDIPREVRLMTILDVFDALTARDRPYKKPMPAERAFSILDDMAKEGEIDNEILNLFKSSDAYYEEVLS